MRIQGHVLTLKSLRNPGLWKGFGGRISGLLEVGLLSQFSQQTASTISGVASGAFRNQRKMLAGEGRAIIIISSELPEILGRADRILVIREGKMIGIIERKDAASD